MRALSATLEEAQQSASAAPYVRAEFEDYWGDRPRFRFTRYYDGSEPEGYVGACIAGDGSLVRIRYDSGAGQVYVSRVASPGPASDYSSWTALAWGGGGVALCASGATVRAFYVASGGTTLREKVSTDYGATWGSAVDITTAGGTKVYVAAAYGGSDVVVFWSEGATVYRARYTGPGGRGPCGRSAPWTRLRG